MTNIKNAVLKAVLAAAPLLATFTGAHAQAPYPDKPINIIVPFAAGNVTDSIARLVGEGLARELKQTVVIENRPGASGIVGISAIAQAKPNGYTLGFGAIGPLALNPALYSKLPYNPEKDLSVISIVYKGPILVLVDKDSPIKTPKDLVQSSLSDSKGLDYATPGNGSSQHLTAELFQRVTKAKLVHVPNSGSGQAASLLLGKHVPVLFESVTSAMPFVNSGQMRALAVSSAQRLPILPDVPTLEETGYPGIVSNGWLCIISPKGVPLETQKFLSEKIQKVMATPEMQAAIIRLGGVAEPMTMDESAAYVRTETKERGDLIRAIGIKLN